MKIKLKKLYYSLGVTMYLIKYNFKQSASFLDKIISTIKGYEIPAYLVYKKRYGSEYKKCYSDRKRLVTRRMNDRYNILLDDKYVNYQYFKEEIPFPSAFFTIKDAYFVEKERKLVISDFEKLLDEHRKIIVKPVLGAGGESVYLIEKKDGKIQINYQLSDLSHIFKRVQKGVWLVSEYIEQADYSKRIFPWSANTIRIISLHHQGEVSLVYALHRFGVDEENPTDNWSRGGISAKIDMDTGKISDSVWTSYGQRIENHPISKENIVGVQIPRWNQIINSLVKAHEKHFYIPMIAWDVVVTQDGFSIIEMNASSGVQVIQVHEPVDCIDKLNRYYI